MFGIKRGSFSRNQKISLYLLIILVSLSCNVLSAASSTVKGSSPVPPTVTVEQPSPIPPTPTFEPPAGFVEYQDADARISIYYPENWILTGVFDGGYAIFQSYPLDKYIGGEGFQPGDSKCDLNLNVEAETPEDLLAQWTSDGLSTIVSQEQVTLASGISGLRVELEGWGGSLSMFTVINDKVIALTCYGAMEYFDEIANTLNHLD